MDTQQIVTLLIAERDRLSNAIEALQGPTAAKRRGRPPKNPTTAVAAAPTPAAAPAPASTPGPRAGKRKPRTAAQKRAQAERMRAYWAAKKKGK